MIVDMEITLQYYLRNLQPELNNLDKYIVLWVYCNETIAQILWIKECLFFSWLEHQPYQLNFAHTLKRFIIFMVEIPFHDWRRAQNSLFTTTVYGTVSKPYGTQLILQHTIGRGKSMNQRPTLRSCESLR